MEKNITKKQAHKRKKNVDYHVITIDTVQNIFKVKKKKKKKKKSVMECLLSL